MFYNSMYKIAPGEPIDEQMAIWVAPENTVVNDVDISGHYFFANHNFNENNLPKEREY